MSKIVKIFIFIPIFTVVFFIFNQISFAQDEVNLYLFYSRSCSHCAKERYFINSLQEEYGTQLKIHEFEIFESDENRTLFKALEDIFNYKIRGVPVTVVGSHLITGFLNKQTTGQEIKQYLDQCLEVGCSDKLGAYLKANNQSKPPQIEPKNDKIPEVINLPVIGQLKTKDLSLPFLTIIIAAVDGFNPCAMWVLMFLISLLLSMQSKGRRWLLGSTFVVVSGIVYFLFLAVWLNLFIFLGFILIVRIIIGLVAMTAGVYNLREYWLNRPSCKVTRSEARFRVFDKLRAITQRRSILWALVGITLIAFAVNLVELICSAGLPAVYTQVLSLTALAKWQYYLYLLLYIFIFILDDMLVFIVAMVTLQSVGLSGKYSRFSHLIGGLIIFILGILLIFKPELLMFS